MKRLMLNIAVASAVAIILIAANVLVRQSEQFRLGRQAEKAGNFMEALTGYEYCIRMYTPLSPKVESAASRIWSMAEAAEKDGDIEKAVLAYRSLRSAFYATVWLVQPGQQWIERCEKKIAALAPQRKDRLQ